jgi:tripartite-type tricarboxylate transporter receptor subunit TctC
MVVALILFLLPCLPAGAAEFPQKPVQVLIGWSTGAMNDTIDRVITQQLQRILKQPFIIQNVPGAGASLVLGRVKLAKPDGYTVFQSGFNLFSQTPHLRDAGFDPINDFAYLAQHATFKYLLEDRPDSPWKNFEELLQYAKQNPKKLKYGTSGVGSGPHVMMEYLAIRENIEWVHVPFNSQAEAVTALMGGHVQLVPSSVGVETEQLQTGRIRPLLTLNANRLAAFPDVRSILELGRGYDFSLYSAACWAVPIKTPNEIQKILEEALLQSFKDPAVIEVIGRLNMVYDPRDGKTVAAMIAKDHQAFGDIAKRIGIGIYRK